MKYELDLATIMAISLADDAEIIGYANDGDGDQIATIDITFHTNTSMGNYVNVSDLLAEKCHYFVGNNCEKLLMAAWEDLKRTNYGRFRHVVSWDVYCRIENWVDYTGFIHDKKSVLICVNPEGNRFSASIDNLMSHAFCKSTGASPFMALVEVLRRAIKEGIFDLSAITSWVTDKYFSDEDDEAFCIPEPDFVDVPYIPDDDENTPLPF